MDQSEIIRFAHDTIQNITLYFAQMVTITFAMVVAIYYFLNEARIAIKIFAYFVYLIGMALYMFVMLIESNLSIAARSALYAIPAEERAIPASVYLDVSNSWIFNTTSVLLNLAIWVLLLGVGWLLFFWKKRPQAVRTASGAGDPG